MQSSPTTSLFPHPNPAQRLLALHLIRVRERAGLSRAQLAERTDFSPNDIERIESGLRVLDAVELRSWCRAVGTSLPEFARELDAALLAQEDRQERACVAEREAQSKAPNIQLLCFAPDAPPKLLSIKNVFAAIEFLLGTSRVRVFATDSSVTIGLSANDSTQEDAKVGDGDSSDENGNDASGEYTLLRPTGAFLVVAGKLKGSHVSASAPRNLDLSWAPIEAWVSLCPYALDLANLSNRERLKLGSLSPLQVELALDKFAPDLSDTAVEQIMGEHPDGAAWMAAWND